MAGLLGVLTQGDISTEVTWSEEDLASTFIDTWYPSASTYTYFI
jgi:hypothetical protein